MRPLERIEWLDIWVTNADKNNLPRVLMIGDSITKSYFGAAEKELSGTYNCARLTSSKCVCDPAYPAELSLVLNDYSFDVIQLNNGLHGKEYTEEEYEKALPVVWDFIIEKAPKAKLVWAASTPARDGSDIIKFRKENDRVIARNEAAGRVAQERTVPVNDLYSCIVNRLECFGGDGIHYNEDGQKLLGTTVAKFILEKNS